jgi:cell surface protein SprA
MASTPQGQPAMFPEAQFKNNLQFGFNRAKLAWYSIDASIFYRDGSSKPPNITDNDLSDDNVREILENELFPNKQPISGQVSTLTTFNLAYYPTERGPYNYDVKGLSADGRLKNPQTRWAGISTKIEPPDFDASNIEFIEFWIMDPFRAGSNNKGGQLYFNLGNVSEDVLRDELKSFENGLITDDTTSNSLKRTAWGRIPNNVQSVVPAFDNARKDKQDVGLDGLGDSEERIFFKRAYVDSIQTMFGATSKAFQNAYLDPSGDNFHCSKGADYDNNNASILQRYRKWNGAEGNSVNSGACIYGSTPDNEDINADNSLDILEAYYQYKVELAPNKMNVGQNYITAMVEPTVKLKNGSSEQIKYYQFKIPVRKPDQVIGGIADFKSIRFMRMFMRGFQDSIILRFAKLQLVRSEWRKYTSSLLAPGEYTGGNDNFDKTSFDVTTINLEEDGTRSGIPYVLPPGIDREVALGSATQQRLNEQSLLLRACDLQDGDSRSSFKNVQLDVRNYKKIKMYVHAEKMGDLPLNNGDVSCFIRLGSDFNDNYYEYELPLTVSAVGSRDPYTIWPDANMMEISLEQLQGVKQDRNNDNWPLNKAYQEVIDGKKISVRGVPNLSGIRTIMIGIRNPKQEINDNRDDGQPKCVEMWVNELRLSDFDEKGGWAVNARINAKLADFATINLSGSRITPGFGGIEQKLNDRKKDDLTQYDVSSSLELGKFFPEKSGMRVPMFVGLSEAVSIPQYNPLDPDVKLKDALDNLQDEKKRQELKDQTIDYTKRRSINFTNIKKNKVNATAKTHFYDVENLNLTYAYTETFHHNINIEGNLAKTYRAALGYNYAHSPTNFQPFTKLSNLSKYLQPIADINFYFSPSSVSFRTDVDRQFTVNKQRNVTGSPGDNSEATYYKIFNVNRFYDVKFDLTKTLKLDFNAVNNGVVDEPIGPIDTKSKEDSIKKNFFPGRTTKYHQTVNVSWAVPINKLLPILDFTSLTLKHTVDYDWTTGVGQRRPDGHFLYGNTISNAASTNANLTLTMGTLYNKIPYFQRIMQGGAPQAGPKNFLGGKLEKSLNMAKTDTSKTKKKEEKPPHDPDLYVFLTRLLLSVKTIGGSYTHTQGTLLSGYDRTTQFLGQSQEKSPNGNTMYEPGWGFLLGRQYDVDDKVNNIRYVAARNGWLVKDTSLNNPFIQTNVENYTLKANMEPIPGFRIDLNASRNYSLNHQEFFRFVNKSKEFESQNEVETGNLSMSFFSLNTVFDTENNEHVSPLFKNFRDYRYEISRRASSIDERSSHQKNLTDTIIANREFYDGYGGTSQDVLIPAFIAAYSGKSQSSVKLSPFAMLPAPNWRITYDGLSKLKFVQTYFRSITLGHGYRSNLSVNSFSSNLEYKYDSLGKPNPNNRNPNNHNLFPKYDIAQVSISEQLSPLISVDMAWKNSLTTRVELRRDRTVGLSMANNQVTETVSYEYIIGAGYKIKQFKIPFRINGTEIALKNDLDLKADVGIRQSNTTARKIEENTNIPSAGQRSISIKVIADYVVNERFNIRAFYYRDDIIPIVSTSYNNTNTSIGVSIRFSLSQ